MDSPLFDAYDPYGILRLRARATGDRKATIEDLMPAEQKQGMLRSLANAGGSGIGALFWLLDTPGAVTRGTLEGGLLKGLSALVPGAERVTGRDLLRSYGLVGDEDNWSNFGGGLAAEVLLDPMTYLTLGLNQIIGRGVPTAAGKVAKQLGMWKYIEPAASGAGVGPRRFAREGNLQDLLSAMPPAARSTTPTAGAAASAPAAENLLKAATEAAKREGMGVDDILKMPLSKSHGWSAPLYGSGAFDMFGKRGGDALADFGDWLGPMAERLPGVPRLTSMFSMKVLGHVNPERFDDARRLSLAREAGVPELMKAPLSVTYDAMEYMKPGIAMPSGATLTTDSPFFKRALNNALSGSLEYMKSGPQEDLDFVKKLLDPASDNPLAALVRWWGDYRKDSLAGRRSRGLMANEFTSAAGFTEFFPQQIVQTSRPMLPQQYSLAGDTVDAKASAWKASKSRLDNLRLRGEQIASVNDRATLARDPAYDLPARSELLAAATLDEKFMESLRRARPEDYPQLWRDWANANYSELMADAQEAWGLFSFGEGEVGPLDWMFSPAAKNVRRNVPSTHPLAEELRQREREFFVANARRKAAANSIDRKAAAATARAAFKQVKDVRARILEEAMPARAQEMYTKLSDLVKNTDPQLTQAGTPLFGTDPINAMLSYARNAAETQVNADFMADLLARESLPVPADSVAGGGGYSILQAAKKLGMDPETVARPLIAKLRSAGRIPFGAVLEPEDLARNWSVEKSLIDDWSSRIAPGQAPAALNPLLDWFDSYTRAFKTAALANPSRYVRDQYSGKFAAATQGLASLRTNFLGRQLRAGNYERLGDLLMGLDAPEWRDAAGRPMAKNDRIKKFLVDAASQGLTTGTEQGVMNSVAANAAMRGPYIGATPLKPKSDTFLGKMFGTVSWLPERLPGESLLDVIKRGVAPPPVADEGLFTRVRRGYLWDQNPLAKYSEQWAELTDANNRFDTYTEAILQGNSPTEAKRLADLTQVDYSPEAFTDFERRFMRRVFPFYSYTRGIVPLIYENAMAVPSASRPTSLRQLADPLKYGINPQNMAMRLIDRASTPDESRFVPENLRQQASVPLPAGLPIIGVPEGSQLQRYITNIDLPWAPLNLLSAGVGNSPWETAVNTLAATGMNVLGQMNPLPKTALESLTNRQFFSGNQLSDLYSMLEQGLGAPGRSAEQFVAGVVPGGSKILGLARTAMDDRLTPSEAAVKLLFNNLTGLRVKDVDEARAQQFTARDILTRLLAASKDVREYQTLSVKPDDLANMPKRERDMYLLYKIVQAESARKARERKKAEAASALLSR